MCSYSRYRSGYGRGNDGLRQDQVSWTGPCKHEDLPGEVLPCPFQADGCYLVAWRLLMELSGTEPPSARWSDPLNGAEPITASDALYVWNKPRHMTERYAETLLVRPSLDFTPKPD